MEKVLFNFMVTKVKLNELRVVSKSVDLPVSALIKMGITLILKKYKDVLVEENKKNVL